MRYHISREAYNTQGQSVKIDDKDFDELIKDEVDLTV